MNKEVKYIKDEHDNILSVTTKELLPFEEAKRRYKDYPKWKEFEAKWERRRLLDSRCLITKTEFDRIKVGDRLISTGGNIRWVVHKSRGFVTFKKIMLNSYRSRFTGYIYTDVKWKYVIYPKQPTKEELKEFRALLKEYNDEDRRIFPHLYTKKGKKWIKKVL